MNAILGLLYIAIILCLYFLPYIIAVHKNHPRKGSIGWINLLFGWTFIGWGIALVWAITDFKY